MNSSSSYFPVFVDLSKKHILLIGGGKIARDKLEKLLDFTTNIKVVSKEFSDFTLEIIQKNHINYEKREYKESDLDSVDIVISAIDDIELQKKIYHQSREKRVLVNSVDSKDFCDFIFGSYIKEEDLIISISTSGSSPSVSRYLKVFLKKTLPKNLSSFLRKVKSKRDSLPKGKERMEVINTMVKDFFDSAQ